MTDAEKHELVEILEGDGWKVAPRLKAFLEKVEIEEEPEQRTLQQNKSIHVYCEGLANALNEAGKDMKLVLKDDYAIPWTKESVKEHIWKPIQKAMYQKDSTTKLSKKGEIEAIHKVIMRELGEKHGIEYQPFPSEERKQQDYFWDIRNTDQYPPDPPGGVTPLI